MKTLHDEMRNNALGKSRARGSAQPVDCTHAIATGVAPAKIVFLLDVDDTLLDTDRITADLTAWLDVMVGKEERNRFWKICAERHNRLGYADYLDVLRQLRENALGGPTLLQMSVFLTNYSYSERLHPDALNAVRHLRRIGRTVILSKGNVLPQQSKIERAGLWEVVDGGILVYPRNECVLDAIERSLPADHYVAIDSKPWRLAAMKRVLGSRLTTIFVRHGQYDAELAQATSGLTPDFIIEHIGGLCELSIADFNTAAAAPSALESATHATHSQCQYQ